MSPTNLPIEPALERGRILRGALGGLGGGVVFGAMMASAGMLGMVARLVGGGGDAVGWPVHLLISGVFGALFGIGVRPSGALRTAALGVAWGVVLWAVAAMLVMRSVLGAPVQWDPIAAQSLAGHVAYGVVLGLVYALLPAPGATRDRASPRAG